MRFINYVKFVRRFERYGIHAFAQFTDVVDARIRCAINLIEVLVGNPELTRKNSSDRSLARAAPARKEIRVRGLVVLDGLGEHVHDLRLPPHLLECRWAVGAVQRGVSGFFLHSESIPSVKIACASAIFSVAINLIRNSLAPPHPEM